MTVYFIDDYIFYSMEVASEYLIAKATESK
jgi:hypothetical protein